VIRGLLYRRLPAVGMAVRNLARTRRRSALAALGIVIGVFAITTLGMFGTALKVRADQQFSYVGNEVVVEPAGSGRERTLTRRQIVEIDRVTEGTVVPIRRGFTTFERRGERTGGSRGPVDADAGGGGGGGDDERTRSARLYGIEYPGTVYHARNGTVRSPLESGVLVGSVVAEREGLAPGSVVTIDNRSYRVHAVLANYTDAGYSSLEVRHAVVVPPGAIDATGYHEAVIVTENQSAANRTAETIRERFDGPVERVEVQGPGRFARDVADFYSALNLFLLGLASISLTVAGVSILNVMLMSTVERREEIGVLRAVGFQRGHVLRMILAEAAVLGVIGGLVGVGASGLVGLAVFEFMLDDPTALFRGRVYFYAGLGFAFGVLTGVVSGAYPAWSAANERPVDALRS